VQFATNVLEPFLLTGLLLPSILGASAPRVVNVSSYLPITHISVEVALLMEGSWR
jgi:NAD(P)-dependent dehydrogenase (short-subunit alcohol dehydrogenase family)